MDDKTFKEYYEIERLKYCMGVVADWLNEHRDFEIVEGEDRGTRVFAIQTKSSPLVAEVKKIFPFCCYEPKDGAKMVNEEVKDCRSCDENPYFCGLKCEK